MFYSLILLNACCNVELVNYSNAAHVTCTRNAIQSVEIPKSSGIVDSRGKRFCKRIQKLRKIGSVLLCQGKRKTAQKKHEMHKREENSKCINGGKKISTRSYMMLLLKGQELRSTSVFTELLYSRFSSLH